jgi:hypothetical protein
LCVFCLQKDSMQGIFIRRCFLLTLGSVCRVKLFRWWRRGWHGSAEVAETTVKISVLRVSTHW